MEALKLRQREELAALRRGDPGAAAVANASSNPVYQSIQTTLNAADVEIAALRSQLADHQRNEAELRRLVDTAPEVEAEYARLTVTTRSRARSTTACWNVWRRRALSGDAEQTGVVKFNIVDPPSASFKPTFPNRPLFLFAVFVRRRRCRLRRRLRDAHVAAGVRDQPLAGRHDRSAGARLGDT